MWITKTKSGKYRVFERYPLPDRKYKTLSVLIEKDTAANRKAALAELNRRAERLYIRDCSIETAALAYIADAEKTSKPQSALHRRSRVNTLLSVIGGKLLLSQLTAGYIRQKVLAENKSDTWKNGVIKTAKGLLKWSYENDYLQDTKAADKLKLILTREKKKRLVDKYLTREELRVFLDGIPEKDKHWKLVTEFLALTGLRFGEFSALLQSDILPDYISVTKTYNMNVRAVGTPKTEESNRRVYIQPELADCIKRINSYTAMLRLQNPEIRELPFFFPNPLGIHTKDGGRLNYESFDRFLRVYAPQIIGKHISAHTLRHTHASLLFEQGFSVDEVGRRLGHKAGSAITREIYIHVTADLIRKDNEHLARTRLL